MPIVELTLRERLLLQSLLEQEKENLKDINNVLSKNITDDENNIYKLSVRQNERKIKEIEVLLEKLGG